MSSEYQSLNEKFFKMTQIYDKVLTIVMSLKLNPSMKYKLVPTWL